MYVLIKENFFSDLIYKYIMFIKQKITKEKLVV